MIKETLKKIHFISYTGKKGREKDESEAPTVMVSAKYGRIVFPRSAMTEMGMDGKFVKFFYEPTKKIIGWKIESKLEHGVLGDWQIAKLQKSGVWAKSIIKLIDELGIPKTEPDFLKLPIKKYREKGMLVAPNSVYYYVEVKRSKKA